MAKKKTPKDSEAQIRTRQLKELQGKHRELEGKLEAAIELISDGDKEVAKLQQKIEDDTGIPPSTAGELISAKKVAKKLEEVNGALKAENIDLKARLKDIDAAAPILSEAPAKTKVPMNVIANLLGDINVSMQTSKFIKCIPVMLDNAIILAEAIQARHESNPLSDPCEDEE